jgi:hypothetical protein
MKLFTMFVVSLILLTTCSSPEKLLQQGNYDAIVEKAVKNLIKNPNSEEDAVMLDKAYKLANDRDIERVKYLKMEGNPDTWDEMLSIYGHLKDRQTSVSRVLPLHINGQTVQYEFVDYNAEIIAAKRKASEYFNIHGRKLMENKTKESYRLAYYELVKAKNYSGDSYPDLNQVISEAKEEGMSRALIGVVNRTIINLPQDFTDGLVAVNANEINSEWVEYHTRKMDDKVNYDYYIDIILQEIVVSPDLVQDNDLIEKKRVDDGYEYVLDAKGNVMKDTSGNDIKIKKYKEIQCTVIESHQIKDCNIKGEIEFISTNPQSLLKKQPIAANTHFEYISARAIGDVNAVSSERKKLLAIKPVPFPNDIQMIIDCTEALKRSIHEAINYNRGIIR